MREHWVIHWCCVSLWNHNSMQWNWIWPLSESTVSTVLGAIVFVIWVKMYAFYDQIYVMILWHLLNNFFCMTVFFCFFFIYHMSDKTNNRTSRCSIISVWIFREVLMDSMHNSSSLCLWQARKSSLIDEWWCSRCSSFLLVACNPIPIGGCSIYLFSYYRQKQRRWWSWWMLNHTQSLYISSLNVPDLDIL